MSTPRKPLDRPTLMRLGKYLQGVLEPVTQLPLTANMVNALARLDLSINSREVARNVSGAIR